jgi:hypothetical protein
MPAFRDITPDDTIEVGEIIEDSYGNKAIVLTMWQGRPDRIMQLVGSDEGNVTRAPRIIRIYVGDYREETLAKGREVWKKHNLRRSMFRNQRVVD